MKIAILNCLKANDVCTGGSCLRAFNARTKHFEQYKDEKDLELVALARCNGCDAGIDKGFEEKLQYIVDSGAEVCHVGVCTVKRETGKECPVITEALERLEKHGIKAVRGTH